ncbi:MAG: hypothetical protein PVF05_09975 [Gemmatimonadales bacterium]|jgi:hypothetical protein
MATLTRRFLAAWAALATGLLGGVAFLAARPATTEFDEITVRRINVVEPDGTLRLVISNHDRLPGIVVRGEERPFDRPQAGMIFYNDEASEIGGLIFGGRRDANGDIVDSGGSLTFDRYEANQIVQLAGVDDSHDVFAGLSVADSPSGREVHRRIWVGRGEDGRATIALMDGAGRRRLALEVPAEGSPSVTFLAEDGSVLRRWTADE